MQAAKILDFQQARNFSSKMNATFEFIKHNFKPLSKSLLFIAGPPVLVGSLFMNSVYGEFLNLAVNANNPGGIETFEQYVLSPSFWLQVASIMIFSFLAVTFVLSVVYNYMLEYKEKQTTAIEVNVIWNRVRQTLPVYLANVFFYTLALVITYFLAIIPMILLTAISPFLIIIGMFLIIGVFVYIWVNLSLVFIVSAYERKNFFESVGRSFYLMKNKWWSTFGLIMVTSIIHNTASTIFFIPWYINFIIRMLHRLENDVFAEPSMISQIIDNVFLTLFFLFSFLLYAIPLIAVAFQYFNLVELKEAKGLLQRMHTFGQTTIRTDNDEQY